MQNVLSEARALLRYRFNESRTSLPKKATRRTWVSKYFVLDTSYLYSNS